MQWPSTNRIFAYAVVLMLAGSLFSLILPAFSPSYALHENVTLDISSDDITDTYEPGDSVAIVGTIDNIEDAEDVTIKVRDPSGSTKTTQNVEPDEDDGYFDFLYNIPNNAAEGAWSIEAEYSNDNMFTYFLVDDVSDTVIIELNNEDLIYEAGDEVEITGMVDEADEVEENVLITVLDPVNDEVLDEEEVPLDGDEFDFSFDLENDAAHGRYAIIVTYDINDQEGSILFEIEDEDTGSGGSGGSTGNGDSGSDGDLSAELDEEIYEPGSSVTVSGTIEDYDDTEELQIVIEDPESDEVESEDDVNVEEDGTDGEFSFEFDLEDDAPEGDYFVVISYANDEVELTFEVEGEGDSGSDELTVKLNKASYLAGETMTVTGVVADVADPEDGEQVSLFLYTSEGQVILEAGASKYVTPSSNGAYSATILIPSDLDEDDGYRVRVSYLGETVEGTFEITGVSANPSDELSVETDRAEYSTGQTVEISGEVPSSLLAEGEPIVIRINKPDGSPCRIDQVDVPSSGSYDYEMVLGGTCGIAGEYEIEVTYSGEEGSTTFELVGSSVSQYGLVVEGDTYPVEYEMSGGSVNGMFVRTMDKKLVINIDATQDGELTLVLPREVIDAVEDGQDVEYIVTIEDGSGDISSVQVEESENTDDVRTIVIDYRAGAERIEITGTQVVPEFGTIAAIVMAVAIVGIIVVTARYQKFGLLGQ